MAAEDYTPTPAVEFVFPFKGYDVGSGVQKQPPFSSPKLLNVWPYDHNGRATGAVRGGLRRAYAGDSFVATVGATGAITTVTLSGTFGASGVFLSGTATAGVSPLTVSMTGSFTAASFPLDSITTLNYSGSWGTLTFSGSFPARFNEHIGNWSGVYQQGPGTGGAVTTGTAAGSMALGILSASTASITVSATGGIGPVLCIAQAVLAEPSTGARTPVMAVVRHDGRVMWSTNASTGVSSETLPVPPSTNTSQPSVFVTATFQGTNVATFTPYPQAASSASGIFFVDGQTKIRVLAMRTTIIDNTLGPWPPGYTPAPTTITANGVYNIEAAGSMKGTAPTNCSMIAAWRARIVVSGQKENPHLVYASRVGNPFDWDSGSNDPTASWVLNVAQAGNIGDVVTALMPSTDDTLLIGQDRGLYRLDGDVTDGGSLSVVSTAVGVCGPRAWCSSGDGTTYFVNASGLWSYGQGGLRNLSGARLGAYWRTTVRQGVMIQLAYDPTRNGVWVFATATDPALAVFVVNHLFYDIDLDAFFPMSFLRTEMDPTAVVWQHDPNGWTRGLLLGGADGLLRRMSSLGCGDGDDWNGTTRVPILSHCLMGPVMLAGDVQRSRSHEIEVVAGTNRFRSPGYTYFTANEATTALPALGLDAAACSMRCAFIGGPDPQTVQDVGFTSAGKIIPESEKVVGTNHITVSTWGWQPPVKARINANAMSLVVWNQTLGKTWAFERATVRAEPAGRVR